MQASINNIDDLKATDFTLGNTQFRIHKLLPMEGFRVLEDIRAALGPKIMQLQSEDTSLNNMLTGFVGLVLSVSTQDVQNVMRQLFIEAYFKDEHSNQFVSLSGNEGLAFKELEPFHVYEVLARCLVINFTGSLDEIMSRTRIRQTLRQQDTTTSPPFSPSQ